MKLLQQNLTEQIIKTFFDVYNDLGYGFLEKVYQNAFYLELKNPCKSAFRDLRHPD